MSVKQCLVMTNFYDPQRISLDAFCRAVAEIGYAGIELMTPGEALPEIVEACHRHGLAVELSHGQLAARIAQPGVPSLWNVVAPVPRVAGEGQHAILVGGARRANCDAHATQPLRTQAPSSVRACSVSGNVVRMVETDATQASAVA